MPAYFSVKVLFSSQTMMGRFLRSLKVGRSTEYLFLTAIAAAAVVRGGGVMDNGWGNNEWQQLELQWE